MGKWQADHGSGRENAQLSGTSTAQLPVWKEQDSHDPGCGQNRKRQRENFRRYIFDLGLAGRKKGVALSDGMGSGERAFRESTMVVEMLEELLNAGFPVKTAVQIMNTAS